jgi:tRNA-Thr(GGU) m(6)t(6)A37 methyltransferase TsaA
MKIEYEPIGTIYSPFTKAEGMPIQPAGAEGVKGTAEIRPTYTPGLKDLAGFSHIVLLYHFHRVKEAKLVVTPFMDSRPRGIFATRAPKRPNPIGMSIVRLESVEGSTLHLENVDILDGTPLLDIKPYIPEIDRPEAERIGWLKNASGGFSDKKSDDRFKGR